jgi:hypothetical protein
MDELLKWIDGLTKPQEALGGMPICPFAKKGMKDNKVVILCVKSELYSLIKSIIGVIKNWDVSKELYVIVDENYSNFSDLKYIQSIFNKKYFEFTFLLGHPDHPFSINGITTTFKEYPIIFLQKRDDINKAQEKLLKTNYYDFWTEDQLDNIVNWRK